MYFIEDGKRSKGITFVHQAREFDGEIINHMFLFNMFKLYISVIFQHFKLCVVT